MLFRSGEEIKPPPECTMTLNVSAFIPGSYVSSAAQRMSLYKRIAQIRDQLDREDITDELLDRYGELPRAAANLLKIALLRSRAERCGITQIRQDGATVHIVSPNLDVDIWMELSARFPGKLRMMLSANPYIQYRIDKGQAGLDGLVTLFGAYLELLESDAKKVDKS